MTVTRALSELARDSTNIISNIRSGDHICLLYHTKQELIDVLVPYFKAGLENYELCIWITSERLKAHEATMALSEAVEGLDNYIKNGNIYILDQSDWYIRGGKFDYRHVLQAWWKKELSALRKGFNGLRSCGDMHNLKLSDWHKLIRYEAIVDSVLRKHKMIGICCYLVDQCTVPELVNIVSNHRFILLRHDESWDLIDNTGYRWPNELRSKRLSYDAIGRKLGFSRELARQIINGQAIRNKKVSRDGKMLTSSNAAKLLSVHINTLRRWTDEGLLPCYRMGPRGDRKYRRSEVVTFMKQSASH